MKKIEFGYNNSFEPNSSFEGVGINIDGDIIYDANLVGIISKEQENLLIINKKNKLIVLPVLADIYANGDITLFVREEPTELSSTIEDYLNENNINNIDEIIIKTDSKYPNKLYDIVINTTPENNLPVISISKEAFSNKKLGLKYASNNSISDLGLKLFEIDNKLNVNN